MKKSILKDTLSLVLITLVAALCLAGVFQLTKNAIAEAEETERMDSFKAVFPEAADFKRIPDENLAEWNNNHSGAELIQGYETFAGPDSGSCTGVVLSSVSHSGYGGDVTLSVGVRSDGTITGVKVTSMSETSGLGANCTKEEWVAQFAGKTSETIGFVRGGSPNEDEIDALTGATITTKAVLEAVNQAIAFAHSHLGLSQ